MKSCSLLLTVTLGLALVGCGETATPPAPAKQPLVVQAPLEAEDLARALNMYLYCYHVDLEPGEYKTTVWMESWTKGVAVPETSWWGTSFGNIRSGRMLLQIPTKEFPQGMFGIDGRFSKGPKLEQFWVENRLGGGLSHNTVYDFPVVLDKDLTLFTATADEAGVVQTSSPDYSTHGRAWVVKVRFSRANKSDINAK
jgi:hypothetical protein